MQEEFEDTKGVIRIRNSKDMQHNGQKKKDKRTKKRSTKHYIENYRSSKTNPTKNRGFSGRVTSSCSTSGTHRVTLVTITVISHE